MADRRDGPSHRRVLARECRTLFGYVFGGEPAPALVERYLAGHRALGARLRAPSDGLDGLLLRAARRGRLLARLADTYARLFRPGALIRRKLSLLVAIVESTPEGASAFDSPDAPAGLRFLGTAAVRALGFALALAASVALFAPAALLAGGRAGGEDGRRDAGGRGGEAG